MKDINEHNETPFILSLSFDKLMKQYEKRAKGDDLKKASRIDSVLKIKNEIPILSEGFSDVGIISKYQKEIDIILEDVFCELLTHNEIKTASVPFHNFIFHSSKRFKTIVKNAGENFVLQIKNLEEQDKYRMVCNIILSQYYGFKLNFKPPFFYEIPSLNGVVRTYKILYNADFIEIIPTERAPKITEADFIELLDNFDDFDLWKAKFPPQSYILKGFAINNIFDVTDDTAISEIKSNLLESGKIHSKNFVSDLEGTFEQLFDLKNVGVGFAMYNESEQKFEPTLGKGIDSYLLFNSDCDDCKSILCRNSYKTLIKDNKFYCISDVDKYFKLSNGIAQYKALHNQGVKSAILAPIASERKLLGILELVSEIPYELNSVNASKLDAVMPFIVASVLRSKAEEENLIDAIIQSECTSIHPSVNWKFEEAARKFLLDTSENKENVSFSEITFNDIYPLYGQMDVSGSSDARNNATRKDLSLQLNMLIKILKTIHSENPLPICEQYKFQIKLYLSELDSNFKVDSEQQISIYVRNEIEPFLKYFRKNHFDKSDLIDDYFNKLDNNLHIIYYYRKHYDDTITMINQNMSLLLDRKQIDAQNFYPHYFERYKTDGVDHNMYIGESITKEVSFNQVYLYNLRLWQLQVMCEMENEFYNKQNEYPIALDVASMILVFNQPISIRFRMDEKRFDVDGTYNARYEVIKKRVDKANIKGTNQRVTKKGKITIVYSQKEDEEEYLKYLEFLKSKHYFDDEVEIVELEDLQSITGLKAIRVGVLYHKKEGPNEVFYTYEDLMSTINS